MDLICNDMSPILSRSAILCPEHIEELHLFCCNREIDLKLPSLRHVSVISSLAALHRCSSISINIQSMIIVLERWHIPYITGNWTALRSLRSLSRLRSLRVVLYDLHMSPDDAGCETIAETAILLLDFALSFRLRGDFHDMNPRSAFKGCCLFVEQLQRTILALSFNGKSKCFVEKDGCGLIVWREQRYQCLV